MGELPGAWETRIWVQNSLHSKLIKWSSVKTYLKHYSFEGENKWILKQQEMSAIFSEVLREKRSPNYDRFQTQWTNNMVLLHELGARLCVRNGDQEVSAEVPFTAPGILKNTGELERSGQNQQTWKERMKNGGRDWDASFLREMTRGTTSDLQCISLSQGGWWSIGSW